MRKGGGGLHGEDEDPAAKGPVGERQGYGIDGLLLRDVVEIFPKFQRGHVIADGPCAVECGGGWRVDFGFVGRRGGRRGGWVNGVRGGDRCGLRGGWWHELGLLGCRVWGEIRERCEGTCRDWSLVNGDECVTGGYQSYRWTVRGCRGVGVIECGVQLWCVNVNRE